MQSNVMEKYRNFASDYNSGMDRENLCQKYRIKDDEFDAFLTFLKRKGFRLAVSRSQDFMQAHEIDFEIFGDDMQYVEIELDPHETAIAEAGAMMHMGAGIEMETIFGDGSSEHEGTMAKIFGAGKRILTGESLFMTAFTNASSGKETVAFSASYPGKIIPVELQDMGGELICQKDAFLCAAKGVSIGIAFQKKLGAGFFGGEGFILQKLQGDGLAFVHAGGTICEKYLEPMETLKVDTGCIVAFEPAVDYDIQFVGGIKSTLFGGEGLFFATLRGPGRCWLQSMPFSRLASRFVSSGNGNNKQFNIQLGS
jgi:uncharacterized protein (TIGR00266 family)